MSHNYMTHKIWVISGDWSRIKATETGGNPITLSSMDCPNKRNCDDAPDATDDAHVFCHDFDGEVPGADVVAADAVADESSDISSPATVPNLVTPT